MAQIKGKQLLPQTITATQIANTTITGAQLATGAVSDPTKIAASAVDSSALAANAVTTAKIAANAVTGTQIASGAIDASGKFAAGVVDATALATSAVTTTKIAANAVTSAKVDSSILVAAGTNPLSANWSVGGYKITSLADPTVAQDAATKAYVDLLAQGLTDYKASCRVATTGNLSSVFNSGANTLTASAVGALSIDGVSLSAGDRVLVKDQGGGASSLQNGIYSVTNVGSGGSNWVLTRSTDADTSSEVTAGMFTYISEGTVNAGSAWVLATPDPITLNTTALQFVQFNGASSIIAGNGLSKSGNTLSVNPDSNFSFSGGGVLQISTTAAGAGLTGGGANTPLAVGAGNGIQVNADSVEVLYGSTISTAAAGASSSAGVANTAARSDHAHAFPTAAPVAVGSANAQGSSSSFARADHVHQSYAPAIGNKNMTGSVTAADGQLATATTIAATPGLGSYVEVHVNGISYNVGNGSKTLDCYFSGDGGTTARAFSAITSGDSLYWNGSIAGFQLDATDRLDFFYNA